MFRAKFPAGSFFTGYKGKFFSQKVSNTPEIGIEELCII